MEHFPHGSSSLSLLFTARLPTSCRSSFSTFDHFSPSAKLSRFLFVLLKLWSSIRSSNLTLFGKLFGLNSGVLFSFSDLLQNSPSLYFKVFFFFNLLGVSLLCLSFFLQLECEVL